MESISKRFGHRLKVALVDVGMTQEEVAQRTGLSQATVGRHVRGISSPTLDQLAAYAAALGAEFIVAPATGLEPVTYRSTTGVAA